jgi:hypothetical protein
MSTPTPARDTTRTAFVPRPRQAVEPPADASIAQRSSNRQVTDTEPVNLFGRFSWLTPALGVACTIAVFVAMIVLTWAAGGITPFND